MAFAFVHGFPFDGESCFVSGPGATASCAVSCGGMARAGARSHCAGGRRRRGGCSFSFGDNDERKFEVVETPESYLIFFDASGFRRENLRVWVTDGRLFVRAAKNDGGVVEKSWSLSEDVLQDGVSAKLDGTELTVVLPKMPEDPKEEFEVPIESGREVPVQAQPEGNDAPGPSNQGAEPDAGMDADGTWVEVADEDVANAKAKGKAPASNAVLQDANSEDKQ